MRAPITSVVKQVASSSKRCNQYRGFGGNGTRSGIGRKYSMVEEVTGEFGSGMRNLRPRDSLRPEPLDATTSDTINRREGKLTELLESEWRDARSWQPRALSLLTAVPCPV